MRFSTGSPGILAIAAIAVLVLTLAVETPHRPRAGSSSQGVQAHLSAPWNQEGFSGQGVKVGIINPGSGGGFLGLQSLMGRELPTTVKARCYTRLGRFTSDLADCDNGGDHGTKVAESIVDIAPEASLYIATPGTKGDFRSTVDWMISEGISVIVYPGSRVFDGPGDGTSPFDDSPLKAVDRAVDEGIVWVNSAGNEAQTTWFTRIPADADDDRWLEFSGPYEANHVSLDAGERVIIQLRWKGEWGLWGNDLDLLLYDSEDNLVASSLDYQWGPQAGSFPVPHEVIVYDVPADGEYKLSVRRAYGSLPDWVQLVAWVNAPEIQYHTFIGSIGNPAESANPGMLATGAAHWAYSDIIEPYSSGGPTPDGRVKPNIVGADCGLTSRTPLDSLGNGFCGTSQASAHVAGMAALVRQRFPHFSAQQVATYLKHEAVQRAAPDPNNTWGYGFAQMPPPLPPAAPLIHPIARRGPDWLTVTWLFSSNRGGGPVTAYDLRHIEARADSAVDTNWTMVNGVWPTGSGSPEYVITGLNGGDVYKVQMRAVNVWGTGDWSADTIGTTLPAVMPGAPTALRAEVSDSEAKVELSWVAPALAGGAPTTGYRIESSADGNDPWVEVFTTTGGGTTYTDDGTDGNGPVFGVGATQYYRVLAMNSVGVGPPSNVALASQAHGLGAFTSQGVQAHLSAPWNQEGFSGQGVKVGIINYGSGGGFLGYQSRMGGELPATVKARCYTGLGRFTSDLADCDNRSNYGTAVAESAVDIAPEVSLYIANPGTKGDFRSTVDWMISEGVSVINHSVTWTFDGPGDGTSPFSYSPLKAVDRAVDADIIWVNAAWDSARRTWFSDNPVDADNNRWLEFSTLDEVNNVSREAGDSISVQLRWEGEWGRQGTDLDLFLYDSKLNIIDSSEDRQSGSMAGSFPVPWERIVYEVPTDGVYSLAIWHYSGSLPDWVQLVVWGGPVEIEHHTLSGSIGNPAESANPGMLAVGAADWADIHTIKPYSSRGPTPDGSIKPDIIGATCGETSQRPLNSYGNGFCGTSQAASHVAGMAALVRQRFPDFTPVEVANYLKENAEQRRSPDPNNTWGHGFAQLLSPDRVALEALYNSTSGDNWANNDKWLSDAPIGQWIGVTTGPGGRVTVLNLIENQLSGAIPAELGSLTNLQRLYLSDNLLTGPIPSELGNLANLEYLNLDNNQLSGEIPAELGNLTNLHTLWLYGNELTGSIPAELGDLTSLEWLDLSSNQLTGPIPSELGGLANLQTLYLSYNQLTGCVPDGLRDVQRNDFGELGLGFCGGTPPVGDPLVARYDANNNGTIEKGEVIAAINDYLFGEGDEAISKPEVIRLINLYLFG